MAMSARGRDEHGQPVEPLQGGEIEQRSAHRAGVWEGNTRGVGPAAPRSGAHWQRGGGRNNGPVAASSARQTGPSLALAFQSLSIRSLNAHPGIKSEGTPVLPLPHLGRPRRAKSRRHKGTRRALHGGDVRTTEQPSFVKLHPFLREMNRMGGGIHPRGAKQAPSCAWLSVCDPAVGRERVPAQVFGAVPGRTNRDA